MISINNLTVAFGGYTLLNDINFHISQQDRIGLVGKNGAGKSTMLKLICGIQRPTSGSVSVPKGCRIGYLPQIMEHHKGRSVLDECLTAFDDVHKQEEQLDMITAELAARTDYESQEYNDLMVEINDLTDSLALAHSELPEVQARKTLKGLGFKDNELSRPTETFSQGWNMRIELAKILLRHPDVLLLDEPTNHLDIESIEWLEDYLKENRSALVIISHDRKFLDTVTNRTVEIMLGHIHDYKVPYSKYVELRAERMEQQRAAFENQQRMIEKTEDFIERFRYKPTKSNQVQSRVKALEKLERIEIDVEDKSTLAVKFPPAPRSGDVVFKATDLSVGYPTFYDDGRKGVKVVFENANVEVRRGDKVAFVGRNGEGKTTLMRVIMKQLEPVCGEAKVGYNVNIGYYEQNQEDVLDKNNTVFGTLDDIAVGDIRVKLRDILAAFLFKGEDIDKKVSVLSGGERARLAMAKLMLKPYNLLALDEPTNHMDIRSKDVLKQALKSYDGTLIVVSHDRDFLDGLVDKIYEFRDGKVTEHLGGVQDYLRKKKLENLAELERHDKAVGDKSPVLRQPSAVKAESAANVTVPDGKKFISKEERKVRIRIEKLEEIIDSKEKELKDIEKILIDPSPTDNIMELTAKYMECKSILDARTEEWEKLVESLDGN